MKTTIEFASDFTKGDNRLFIALTGSKLEMAAQLKRIAAQFEDYGKPAQGIIMSHKVTSQVITPFWDGQEY